MFVLFVAQLGVQGSLWAKSSAQSATRSWVGLGWTSADVGSDEA
jgi:hypothetical protein